MGDLLCLLVVTFTLGWKIEQVFSDLSNMNTLQPAVDAHTFWQEAALSVSVKYFENGLFVLLKDVGGRS